MADEVAASLDDVPSGLLVPEDPPETTESDPVVAEGKTYTAAEYKALQAEARTNREKAQQYERLYGQNSELRQFHEAAQAYADGDIDTTQSWLLSNAAAVLGVTTDQLVEKFTEPDDDDDKPLTKREWKELQKAQIEAQRAELQQEQTYEVIAYARELGYEPGTRPYRRLLDLAMAETGNDLDKAHEIMQSEPQGVIDDYLKTQREKAKGGLRPQPLAKVPGTDREITSWGDAETAAKEFLQSRA